MTEAQIKNVAWYVAYALAGALVATGLQFAAALNAPGDIEWRPLAATFSTSLFAALASALGASRLTRLGSEPIAQQVDDLRDQGVPRRDMGVVDLAVVSPMLTRQVKLLAREGYAPEDLVVVSRSGLQDLAARVGKGDVHDG